MQNLPAWANAFNDRKLPAKYVEQKWEGFPKWDFHSTRGGSYAKLPASPWGNELIEGFAEQALGGEKLGQRGVTDLLTISFSSNDYVGHATGPNSPEVRDMALRTDRLLNKLFQAIDHSVGLKNVIIVLSADHGVAATQEHDETARMPGGYVAANAEEAVQNALSRRFGAGAWLIPGAGDTSLYFNWQTLENAKTPDGQRVREEDVYHTAREALLSSSELHVARVYTRDQLSSGVSGDFIALAEMNGFNQKRSGDLSVVFEPGYIPSKTGTTHFSPYSYDRHVPVLFMGPGIKPGHYDANIQINDIAPTLATMLDIQTPSGSSGRVLTEMLQH